MEFESYPMRAPCKTCGETDGRIEEKAGQLCVYCNGCRRWQYNAPRDEMREFLDLMYPASPG